MKKGFSVVELVIGIAIVSVTLVMVLALYTHMMKASAKGIENTVSSTIAKDVLLSFDEYRSLENPDDALNWSVSLSPLKSLDGGKRVYSGSRVVNDNAYYYLLETTPFSLGDASGDADYVKADVAVFYMTGVSSGSKPGSPVDTEVGLMSPEQFFSGVDGVDSAVAAKAMRTDGTGFSVVRFKRIFLSSN